MLKVVVIPKKQHYRKLLHNAKIGTLHSSPKLNISSQDTNDVGLYACGG
jgi:hypothetical protein